MSNRSRTEWAPARAGSRKEPPPQLTDEQWKLIADLFPEPAPSAQGGRPRRAARECVEGILWVLRSGARWKDLPAHFPSPPTCWRRFQDWTEAGVWTKAWARLLLPRSRWSHPVGRGNRRWNVFLGEKRGLCVGKTKRGKGTKTMVFTDGRGLPLAVEIASASPHESTLIESLLERRLLPKKPRRLLYDLAADNDELRSRLARRGVELVCPHRKNRKRPRTQDGRKLRRYSRRWKIERSIGWLQNFRRLVTRYEYHANLFHGFVQLACLMVVMRRF